jgi:MarR family transcriptional regulator, organic hydroperoxide resistance regulator
MSSASSKKSKSAAAKKRSRRSSLQLKAQADLLSVRNESTEDRILFEIRKFIAASIFFNSQAAEKVGLSLTDMQMIHTLQLYGPSTPTRLAASTGLSSGGVTVALDRLEKGGYIRREPNPADRRSLLIHIIPTRLLKLQGIYESVETETRHSLTTLAPRDLDAVVRFFEALSSVRASRVQ